MNEKQIIEYCRRLIIKNLEQYIDTENSKTVFEEIILLKNDSENIHLLNHCEGLKELLEECIKILKGEKNGKPRRNNNRDVKK